MLYTMLFARYPFERPEDKKLNQHDRLQRILHRIIKVTPGSHGLVDCGGVVGVGVSTAASRTGYPGGWQAVLGVEHWVGVLVAEG